jgi:hypothetical protein
VSRRDPVVQRALELNEVCDIFQLGNQHDAIFKLLPNRLVVTLREKFIYEVQVMAAAPISLTLLVTDSQRVRDPIKWMQTAVMSGKWRLVNGRELYDIAADPGQQRNVIDDHVAQTEKMRAFYDAWWAELEPMSGDKEVTFTATLAAGSH